MSRNEIRKMLVEIIKMKTKRTDNDKYIQDFTAKMIDFSLSSADLSQTAVQNYLKNLTHALTEKDINNSISLTEKIYKSGLTREINLFIQEKVSELYTTRRKKKEKSVIKKSEVLGLDLDMTNSQVGNIIGYGQTVWIKNSINNNETTRTLNELFQSALEKKLTGAETAALLKINLGKEAPEKWVKKFGEDKYWSGVADQHISKARTIADIHNYRDAGFDYLRIYARMTERTCEECGMKHRTLVKVSDAVKAADSYLSAATLGDVEGMKKAMPWNADLPVFHFLCQCYTEPVIPGEFIIEDELDKISESDLDYIEKIKSYEEALKKHTNMKHESAVFVDKAGKITGFRDGGRDRVMLDRKSIETIKNGSKIIRIHTTIDAPAMTVYDALVSLKLDVEVSTVTEYATYNIHAKNIDVATLQKRYFELESKDIDFNEIWETIAKENEGFYYARTWNK